MITKELKRELAEIGNPYFQLRHLLRHHRQTLTNKEIAEITGYNRSYVGELRRRTPNQAQIDEKARLRRIEKAGPELLAALQALVDEYEPNIKTFAENAPRKAKWMAALAAIAKATGDQQ